MIEGNMGQELEYFLNNHFYIILVILGHSLPVLPYNFVVLYVNFSCP